MTLPVRSGARGGEGVADRLRLSPYRLLVSAHLVKNDSSQGHGGFYFFEAGGAGTDLFELALLAEIACPNEDAKLGIELACGRDEGTAVDGVGQRHHQMGGLAHARLAQELTAACVP